MRTLLFSKRNFLSWIIVFLTGMLFLIAGCSAAKKSETSVRESKSDPKTENADPSVSQAGAKRGQELFNTVGCMGCHTVNGKGGTVGPNLSDEADKGKSRQWLATQIRDPKSHDPETIMPSYSYLSNEKVNDLVDYLMTLSKKDDSQDSAPSAMNRMTVKRAVSSENTNISLSETGKKWSDMCGRCHNLRSPSEYSDAQWTVAVDQMRLLVPLTSQEQSEVLEFLKASN